MGPLARSIIEGARAEAGDEPTTEEFARLERAFTLRLRAAEADARRVKPRWLILMAAACISVAGLGVAFEGRRQRSAFQAVDRIAEVASSSRNSKTSGQLRAASPQPSLVSTVKPESLEAPTQPSHELSNSQLPDARRKAGAPRSLDTLEQETQLLRGAQAALRATDMTTARAALNEYRARFSQGWLQEEHQMLTLLLQCQTGDWAALQAAIDRHALSRALVLKSCPRFSTHQR